MFRHELGLDQPVWKQFLDYVWQLLHGDFGTSLSSPTSRCSTEFFTLFPATLELSFCAMLFAVAARRAGRRHRRGQARQRRSTRR